MGLRAVGRVSRLRKATRSGSFSIVPNDLWERRDLSYRARGLLVSMTSKPDDWSFRLEYFVERGTEKLDAIKTAYRELRAAGFVRLVRVAGDGGHYTSETWVADEPVQAWADEYADGNRRGVVLRAVPDGGLDDDLVVGPTPDDRKWEIHSRPEVGYPDSGQPTSLVTLRDQERAGFSGDLTTRGRGEQVPDDVPDDPSDDDDSDRVVDLRDGRRPSWAGPGRPPPPDALAASRAALAGRRGRRPRPPSAGGRLPIGLEDHAARAAARAERRSNSTPEDTHATS